MCVGAYCKASHIICYFREKNVDVVKFIYFVQCKCSCYANDTNNIIMQILQTTGQNDRDDIINKGSFIIINIYESVQRVR